MDTNKVDLAGLSLDVLDVEGFEVSSVTDAMALPENGASSGSSSSSGCSTCGSSSCCCSDG